MRIVFFHRRPRPHANFSVEILFNEIRKFLPGSVQWEVKELRYYSQGFFKRLYIGFEAAFNQRDINHITGDVNFIALFLRKRKTLLTMLDLGLMNHPNAVARAILKWFWVILPVKRSSYITTISNSTKTELLKYIKKDPSRIKVVYVPISQQFRHEPKIFNSQEPCILQIGTKPNKNVIRLVKALEGIHCRLEIVGEVNEELKNTLAACHVKYSSSKNLSDAEVLMKYRNADVLSFVSTYEGFGMPIVEANAIGRVVVTSNVLSMPEVAGDAAHLVDPFDVQSIRAGIRKVIEDDAYRDKLIANGLINKTRFEAWEIAKQYVEIYQLMQNEESS